MKLEASETTKTTSSLSRKLEKNEHALKSAFRSNGEFHQTEQAISEVGSPRCKAILADAGVRSTILRSPTLSSEVNDERDVDISVGYDLLDLKRANLTEEAASVRCKRQYYSIRLAQLLTTSEQALTRAGYLAIADYLKDKRGAFESIRKGIKTGLEDGDLTGPRATALEQYLDQILARQAEARGEAASRRFIDKLHEGSFAGLDQQIIGAERKLIEIERRKRTIDALQLSANANYGVTALGAGGTESTSTLGASVKMSVRLGAFYERRHDLEDIGEQARVDAFYEEGSGVFWQSNQLRESIVASLESLRIQKKDVERSLIKAKENSGLSEITEDPDLRSPQLRARIDVIALTSRLRGIEASIIDIGRLNNKLRFR